METLDRLKLKIGSTDVSDEVLEEYLTEAKEAICIYLNTEDMNSLFVSKQIELAQIYYQRDNGEKSVKSASYSEGVVSESTTYQTGADYDSLAQCVLDSLARYRRVYVKRRTQDSTEEKA